MQVCVGAEGLPGAGRGKGKKGLPGCSARQVCGGRGRGRGHLGARRGEGVVGTVMYSNSMSAGRPLPPLAARGSLRSGGGRGQVGGPASGQVFGQAAGRGRRGADHY